MPTITTRKLADGSFSYRAEVRIKDPKLGSHKELKTFRNESEALAWAHGREAELKKEGGLAAVHAAKEHAANTLAAAVQKYIEEYAVMGKFKANKLSGLRMLARSELAKKSIGSITEADIITHIRKRREKAGPSTVQHDLTWISLTFDVARSAWGWPADLSAIMAAKKTCARLKLTKTSKKRDRRPTADELRMLSEYFAQRDPGSIPMLDLMWFAIYSTRRQAELTRIEWRHLNEKNRTLWVMDVKHPREKEGNNKQSKLSEAALRIIRRQPRTSEFIFPYEPKTGIYSAWKLACLKLGIKNLRWHDLRHEGVSRLFEDGLPIQVVEQYSLHGNWKDLQRYTHLNPENNGPPTDRYDHFAKLELVKSA
jgi:integrase